MKNSLSLTMVLLCLQAFLEVIHTVDKENSDGKWLSLLFFILLFKGRKCFRFPH